MDGVKPLLAGTSVSPDSALKRGGSLGRGIIDTVANATASTLEGVSQAEPVADFVDGGDALLIPGQRTAGNRAVPHIATIDIELVSPRLRLSREVTAAECPVADVFQEVQVQGLVVAFPKKSPHLDLDLVVGVGRPRAIDSPSRSLEDEADTARRVSGVEDEDLVRDGSVL